MWNSLVLVVASDSRFGYASLLVSSMEVGYGSAMTIVICSSYCLDVVTYKGRGFLIASNTLLLSNTGPCYPDAAREECLSQT